jgi:hypothetical protein
MKLLVSSSRCPHQFTTHFTGNWHVPEGNALGSKSACSHRMKKGTKFFSIDQMHICWVEYHFQHRLCSHDQSWCVEWSEVTNTHTHTRHFYPNIKWTLFTVFNFQENNCTEHVQPCVRLHGNLKFFSMRSKEEILHVIFQSIWYISVSERAWNLFLLRGLIVK